MMPSAHEPTDQLRKQVKAMSAYGIPQDDIAKVLSVDPKTLRKHYREELDSAETEANAKVAESLYKKAIAAEITGPSVTAAIFWLKTRAGWKETVVNEHSGPDGGPIQTEDVSARDRIARKLSSIAARTGAGEDTGGAE